MKTETRKLDPDLGVWTDWNVREKLETLDDGAFRDLFRCTKDHAREVIGLPKTETKSDTIELVKDTVGLSVVEREELHDDDFKEAETENPESPLFTAEEREDIDKLHWKQFVAKYGMKPAEFVRQRKGGKDDEIV